MRGRSGAIGVGFVVAPFRCPDTLKAPHKRGSESAAQARQWEGGERVGGLRGVRHGCRRSGVVPAAVRRRREGPLRKAGGINR